MYCPQCQHQNSDTAKFCEECGAKLITDCPQCGHQVSPTAKFCGECGAALTLGEKAKKEAGEKGKEAGPQTERLSDARLNAGERRQLTVMFCDLVGSTALSAQLDPEDYQAVVQTYQATCAAIIERYAGHIAQYLGDGLLVYFGYPTAHEDDAQRAVRAGLEIITALQNAEGSNPRLPSEQHAVLSNAAERRLNVGRSFKAGLQVRIGIHTGPVVVGEIGSGARREQLALGETPNVAARLQSLAEPNTIVVSAATHRLVAGLFDCQDLGTQPLKGITTPMGVYRVLGESTVQHRLDAVTPTGLTPLVGREEELALLHRRWAQTIDREGQVVLLSGEPGIGKSRLVRELRNRVEQDNALRLEFRCSPYYQNSALHPVIEHLQRLLRWQKDDTPQTKLAKLHTTLSHYRFPQADTPALFAMLLSLPQPADASPLNLSPQRQKQKTEEALIAWLVEEAEKAPVYCAWEDLHWADPSTLELLGLLIDQTPTARLFVLLTSRPEFTPPWGRHGHFSHLTLSRLGQRQVPQMIEQATRGKPLPAEVVQQIVAKTDGIPLFVEELTKMVLESGLLTETHDGYKLSGPLPPLAIPSTLQDSLMARLDRLASVRELAQLGATIGREFSYELLQAVSPLDSQMLQDGLGQLVETELVYQRGTPPHATYLFKHALIQDTAYQSLLKSKRQQLHQQIAQVLEDRFSDIRDTQPELLAHHYTEAGLITQAIPYWQQAGERASQRSAYQEAICHLTKGLEVLKTLPDTPERARQELALQLALGPSLIAAKGWAIAEVGQAYTRAYKLCQQLGETSRLFPALWGRWLFYYLRGEMEMSHEMGKQLFSLAQSTQDPVPLLVAHMALGYTLCALGDIVSAHEHLERSVTLYDPQQHHALASLYGGADPKVMALSVTAWALWILGYPDRARERSREAITWAQELSHPHSLAWALCFTAELQQFLREKEQARAQAEATIALCSEKGFPVWLERVTITRGWALAEQGQSKEGIRQIHQGLDAYRAKGAGLWLPHFLAILAETYGKGRQTKEGLIQSDEALTLVSQTGERYYEDELYRLKGELTLQSQVESHKSKVPNTQHLTPSTQAEAEAEACFLKAIEIAQQQQAKSLELRAMMSLVRLRQQQATQPESRNTDHESRSKLAEAHRMLSELYHWFTEGFDTKDLQEAKALLEELKH